MSEAAKAKAGGKAGVEVPPGTAVLLGKAQVAAVLGVTPRWVDAMIAAGQYPKPDFYIGVHPRWRQSTHNAWDRAQGGPSKE